ncbi:hypothetical protein BGZ76_000919 [Entomortierella beljakovae]|nr:hypothetical protein BGZ76_000919 [Entomortierella beljakovae]
MASHNTQQLTWNSSHTINKEGRYCYCGNDRRLDKLSLQCKGCQNWFHDSCIEVPLGPVVPFITNYKFLCKFCVVKPTGRNQQNQEPKEPGTVPEFFERVTAGWKEICATTIANLIIQEYLKEAENTSSSTLSKKPNEENMWSINSEYMDWDQYRYYFNKKDHILPYVDRFWKALCTDRSRTQTWWATLGSCLYISKDVFAASDEQIRSASSDFCLVKSNLWNMKPGHITSHQSSSSKSQLPRTPREGKGKTKSLGGNQEDSGGKKTTGRSEKKLKNLATSSNRRPATPPTVPQKTYIPLPNTVVPTKGGDNLAPFSTTNEHPYNRYRFKYVTCEPDPLLRYMLYRQTANPVLSGVRLSREDMSPYMMIDDECMTVSTEKGFRMSRANCGVREGKWYYEVTVDRGGEPRQGGRDGAHVRLGWARREGSKIIVYKNGVCMGVMWQDLFAFLPIEQDPKEKDQLLFDDGTLGYYPSISVYRNGTATANFGPEFKYSPCADPEAEAENIPSKEEQNTWKPMSERWDEMLIEESLIDLVDEVELWVSQEAGPQSATTKTEGSVSLIDEQDTPRGYDYDDGEMSSSGRRDRSVGQLKRQGSVEMDDDEGDGGMDIDSGAERYRVRDDRNDRDQHRRSHPRLDDEYSGSDGDNMQDIEMTEKDNDEHFYESESHPRREHHGLEKVDDEDVDDDDDDENRSENAYYE